MHYPDGSRDHGGIKFDPVFCNHMDGKGLDQDLVCKHQDENLSEWFYQGETHQHVICNVHIWIACVIA